MVDKGSIRAGFGRAIVDLGKKNPNVVVLCADLKDSLKVEEFEKAFPERFFEVGISEQNMMGMAAGMANTLGKVPFVCSYAVFNPGRNWDQLRVSVCYQNSNVKILGGHAGLTTGPDGATHQALEDIAITRVLPNLAVIVPCDEEEMYKATVEASRWKGPVYLRSSREKSPVITNEKTKFEIGKGVVLRDGSEAVIFGCGIPVSFCLDAAKVLESEKRSVAVVNVHTIKPIDEELIVKYARRCGKVVCVEEHQVAGGLGSAILEVLAKHEVFARVKLIGVEDKFGQSGDGFELLEKYGISTKEIVRCVKSLLEK